ncbi:MAG: ribonuclease P protein component [Gammaproteobacteria bacterium]
MRLTSKQFSRRSRLLTPHDYKAVFDAACRVAGPHMAMLAKLNELGYSRLGLVVSKKQIPTAVARNRVKRMIRESFRLQQEKLAGLDIVVIAYKALAGLESPALHLAVDKQWERLRKRFSMA